MKKTPRLTHLIKGAAARAGYSLKALSKEIGIPYSTFITRMENPGAWRICELSAVMRVVDFCNEEIREITEIIRKGGKSA